MTPNVEAADFTGLAILVNGSNLLRPSIRSKIRSPRVWEDLERAKDEYALVVSNLRQMGLPTVFATLTETDTVRISFHRLCCWHLAVMPETARMIFPSKSPSLGSQNVDTSQKSTTT